MQVEARETPPSTGQRHSHSLLWHPSTGVGKAGYWSLVSLRAVMLCCSQKTNFTNLTQHWKSVLKSACLFWAKILTFWHAFSFLQKGFCIFFDCIYHNMHHKKTASRLTTTHIEKCTFIFPFKSTHEHQACFHLHCHVCQTSVRMSDSHVRGNNWQLTPDLSSFCGVMFWILICLLTFVDWALIE